VREHQAEQQGDAGCAEATELMAQAVEVAAQGVTDSVAEVRYGDHDQGPEHDAGERQDELGASRPRALAVPLVWVCVARARRRHPSSMTAQCGAAESTQP